MKKNKNKTLIIILILLLGIGFAYLSTALNINGLANIKGNTWDVYFENVVVSDGSVEADTPTITDKTTVSFYVDLNLPRDYFEFNVDVKNNGSVDAMIESINKSTLSEDQSKYLEYTVAGIREKMFLGANKSKTLTVLVRFKDVDNEDLPETGGPVNLSLSFNAVQADETAVKGITLTEDNNSNGKADVGDKVCIQTECFYVISNNDGEVRALAEWNLLVGNQYDGSSVNPLTNPTGLQDSSAKGYHYAEGTTTTEYPSIGVVAFSSSSYWNGNDGETIDLTNSSNLINGYLTNYKNSLIDLGLAAKEVTLITKSELENLGCSSSSYTCRSAPNWVYQTSYWSRAAHADSDVVWCVFNSGFSCFGYSIGHDLGVRPVISFLESEI